MYLEEHKLKFAEFTQRLGTYSLSEKRNQCNQTLSCNENARRGISTFAPVTLNIYHTENCVKVNWNLLSNKKDFVNIETFLRNQLISVYMLFDAFWPRRLEIKTTKNRIEILRTATLSLFWCGYKTRYFTIH